MEILPAIIGIGGTILGTCLGAYLNSKYSTKTILKQKFLDAAANFRSAFIPEIAKLNKRMSNTPFERETSYVTINKEINKHEEAMIRFRHYILDNKERHAFDLAWKQYAEPSIENHPTNPRIEYFNDIDQEKEIKTRQLIIRRINTLFDFTKRFN